MRSEAPIYTEQKGVEPSSNKLKQLDKYQKYCVVVCETIETQSGTAMEQF